MAYELANGERPFQGPEEHDYREQHLHAEPEPLSMSTPSLAALSAECLFKAPGARPTADGMKNRLEGMNRPASPAGQRLRQVGQAAAERRAHEEAVESAARSAAEGRESLGLAAEQALSQLLGALRGRINEEAPQSDVGRTSPTAWRINLMDAQIGVGGFHKAPSSELDSPGYPAPFDVVAYSSIEVQIPTDQWGYEGRSHSLWYCDAQQEGVFRWHETAFMFFAFSGKSGKKNPFALKPGSDAGRALSAITGTEYSLAWPFTTIDQGNEEEFFERWMGWLADAAEGRLRNPTTMPEKDSRGSWRT